jgi:hypothetical protein
MLSSASICLAGLAIYSGPGSLGSGQICTTGVAPPSWIFTGSEFAKGVHWPEMSAVAQGGLHLSETMSTTLTYSKQAKQGEVLPVNLLCPCLLLGVLHVRQLTLGQC